MCVFNNLKKFQLNQIMQDINRPNELFNEIGLKEKIILIKNYFFQKKPFFFKKNILYLRSISNPNNGYQPRVVSTVVKQYGPVRSK